MTPVAIFNVWREKAYKKNPALQEKFSDREAIKEFLSQPTVAELAELPDRYVILGLSRHINLQKALVEARRLMDESAAAAAASRDRPTGSKPRFVPNSGGYLSEVYGHRPRTRATPSEGRLCPSCGGPEESCRCAR